VIMKTRSNIRYAPAALAWDGYDQALRRLIERTGAVNVCEVGAGAAPLLSTTAIEDIGLHYTTVDVSVEELKKAPPGYSAVVADVAVPGARLGGKYDLILSRMLAEHIADPLAFHQNIFDALAPGGRAFHFFATFYSPPFVMNRILPERLGEAFVTAVWPSRSRAGSSRKFPALYRWCRGPTERQLSRFEAIGYEVEEYVGFFGHWYYRPFLPRALHRDIVNRGLLRLACPVLTSYAYVVLRRPDVFANSNEPAQFGSEHCDPA